MNFALSNNAAVNHALSIATQRQDTKDDGWLVVPIVMSIAKSTGVSSMLGLSLRTIRNALLGDAPGANNLLQARLMRTCGRIVLIAAAYLSAVIDRARLTFASARRN